MNYLRDYLSGHYDKPGALPPDQNEVPISRKGLCDNSECHAILDVPGVKLWDSWTKKWVVFCQPCVQSANRYEPTRYRKEQLESNHAL